MFTFYIYYVLIFTLVKTRIVIVDEYCVKNGLLVQFRLSLLFILCSFWM